MRKTLQELAQLIEGKLTGDGNTIITGAGSVENARPGEITFVKDKKYLEKAEDTMASAVVVPLGTAGTAGTVKLNIPAIEVSNPYFSFVKILNIIYSEKKVFYKGIHPSAILGNNIKLGKNISLGPYCVLGDGCSLGDNTVIGSNSYIGDNVSIGSNTIIYPNVSVREDTVIGSGVIINCGAVIGSDGCGYLPQAEKWLKIPQVGKVVIEDDVEIGSNVSIDRATMDVTCIGKGTKIDNLVHIAHNVTVGENSMLLAHVTLAGSSKIGRHVILSGQSGVIDGLSVGDNVVAASRSGILQDVPADSVVWGMPAIAINEQKRIIVALKSLPAMAREIKELKKKIRELEDNLKKPGNR